MFLNSLSLLLAFSLSFKQNYVNLKMLQDVDEEDDEN